MKTNRTLACRAAAAGLCLLWAASGVTGAQSPPAAPAQPPRTHMKMVPDSKLKHPDPMDDFTGVNFTDAQKARVQQIREKYRTRMHDVAADTRLAPEQRAAMLEGNQRLERGEVYLVLTPEQKNEVRKRILARRKAEQKQRAQPRQSAPQPPIQPLPH